MSVCAIHGGKSLAGAASPTFKTGLHSKYLPTRMIAAYEASLNDPELLDLKRAVSLIDARLIDLLSRVDTGESGALWKDIGKVYADLRLAVRVSNGADMLKALAQMDSLIDRGMSDYMAWSEIQRLLDARRKHVETQQRIELDAEHAVPAKEVVTLIGAILSLAQEAITNVDDRKRFVAGTQSLAGARTGQIQ